MYVMYLIDSSQNAKFKLFSRKKKRGYRITEIDLSFFVSIFCKEAGPSIHLSAKHGLDRLPWKRPLAVLHMCVFPWPYISINSPYINRPHLFYSNIFLFSNIDTAVLFCFFEPRYRETFPVADFNSLKHNNSPIHGLDC